MARILIADDHPIFRSGLRQSLENFISKLEVVEVENFKKALYVSESSNFDLVIMDIDMPGGNSVKMVETFKSKWPDLPVLVVSAYDENLYALAFVKAGADGYLSKNALENELKIAVESALFNKKLYLSEAVREESFRMFMKTGRAMESSQASLSVREREIAQMFISGMGVSEIAGLLDLHTSTVSTHRARIFRKMGVENLMELSRKYSILG
ncbi:response regulator transcription factor [Dyadobacter aurulentus]|uniref:response regulator transcription factor n=1 Tax=Dyadobacter sp. UC 10 TaxID=2605428 RepID=UPI0011F19FF4|nr:response regulator transcription factor [Dyadobacter sp. UC 10]KAA0992058.1 response regulator transcription factor [Dyadobacter sp. UC 10]